jgi:6-pyruvoyl-tetrahydropterin synthase
MNNYGYAFEMSKKTSDNTLISLADEIQKKHLSRKYEETMAIVDKALMLSQKNNSMNAYHFFGEIGIYIMNELHFINAEVAYNKRNINDARKSIRNGFEDAAKKKLSFYHEISLLRAYDLTKRFDTEYCNEINDLMIKSFKISIDVAKLFIDQVSQKMYKEPEFESYHKSNYPNTNLFQEVEDEIYNKFEYEIEINKMIRLDLMGAATSFAISIDTPIGRKTLYKYQIDNEVVKKHNFPF